MATNVLEIDERLPVYIHLRLSTSEVPDMTPLNFNSYLARLAISVDVSAASFANARYSSLGFPQQQQTKVQELQETKHPIFSTVVDHTSLIRVICAKPKNDHGNPNEIQDSSSVEGDRQLFDDASSGWSAVWLVEVLLTRPKTRLISPRIAIFARASLRAKATEGGAISLWTPSLSDEDSDPESSLVIEEQPSEEYLVPLAPLSGMNLLDGLSHDIKFGTLPDPPTLSATKILSPTARNAGYSGSALPPEVIKLPGLSNKIYIPVFPCIALRLRSSRLPSGTTLSEDENVVLANLDIDITAYAKVDVIIRSIEFAVVGGKVDQLQLPTHKFPMRCQPMDGISEIFRLVPIAVHTGSSNTIGSQNRNSGISQTEQIASRQDMIRSVSIKVEYTPVLKSKSESISHYSSMDYVDSMGPLVRTVWNTVIDFAIDNTGVTASVQQANDQSRVAQSQFGSDSLPLPSNGGFRSVSGRSSSAWLQMQQLRSPSIGSSMNADLSPMLSGDHWSLPTHPPAAHMAQSGNHQILSPTMASQVSLGFQQQLQQPAYPSAALREISHEGLSITFTGPTQVLAGEIFTWKVFISNNSRSSKRIALIIQPKKWKTNNLKSLPREPLSQTQSSQPQQLLASSSIVIDDAALQSMHTSGKIEADELVSLVNDIRVGPLGPGAIHETEIKLVALGVGVLSLDGVRVVDLAKAAGFECTNLMNVICRRE